MVEDVREECEKFGPVKQVVIPRNFGSNESDTPVDVDMPTSYSNALSVIDESGSTPEQLFQQQIAKLQQANAMIRPKERHCPLAKVYVEFFEYEDCLQALHQLAGRR